MEIRLIAVGKLRTPGTKELVEEYASRLKRFCTFKIVELPEASGNYRNPEEIITRESRTILSKLDNRAALCSPEGKQRDSREFSRWLMDNLEKYGKLDIVIGGSAGVSREVEEKADWKISFSKLTFPHQLFRGMVCEQLYRAFTISRNMPYHK